MQLKTALAQQQMIPGQLQQQQQQIEATGQENQMRALQLQDQQKLRDLSPKFVKKDDSGNVTGYDFDGFVKGAQAAGISPQTINQLQLQKAETTEKLAGADAATRNNEAAKNKASYDLLEGIRGIQDPQQRQAAYVQGAQNLGKMGVDTSKFPAQVPTNDQLDSIEASLGVHAQIIADAKTKAETFKDQQQGNAAQAQTNKTNAEIDPNNPTSPDVRKAKYAGILQQIQTTGIGSISPTQLQFAKAFENEQRKTTTQADSLGVTSTNTSAPSGLAAARGGAPGSAAPQVPPAGGVPAATPPAAIPAGGVPVVKPATPASAAGSIVDLIGQYKINPTMLTRLIVKHPELVAQVGQKYPGWQQEDYNAKNKILLDYTKDAGSGQIGAINTALGHLGELNDAAKALDQNNIPLLHSIASKVGAAFGGDAATTYTAILHRVGPEMTSAYVKGGGGQGERGANEDDFAVSKGQKQIVSNIGESAKLLYSKMDSLSNNWDKTYQPTNDKDKFENRFITPAAKKMIQNLSAQAPGGANNGGGAKMIQARDPQGKLHQAPAGTPLPAGWKLEQ